MRKLSGRTKNPVCRRADEISNWGLKEANSRPQESGMVAKGWPVVLGYFNDTSQESGKRWNIWPMRENVLL
ncbi:hypothetical protein Pyn_35317 [Prunus yedoensis var. nudiflora]|uniref:Uncharacterized protein n=1 Tax=Prunus yedoensis var. nudiflora TaxID=2094558 RepID=A0A314YW22_PRUYE|nr:hypothetical protein Pyn_35317 [Prunus yedoensis var. nudiflora]